MAGECGMPWGEVQGLPWIVFANKDMEVSKCDLLLSDTPVNEKTVLQACKVAFHERKFPSGTVLLAESIKIV